MAEWAVHVLVDLVAVFTEERVLFREEEVDKLHVRERERERGGRG